MTITFSSILFAFLLIFPKLKKNNFFILHTAILICIAYLLENEFGIRARPLGKGAFMMFVLLHLPLINLITFLAYGRDKNLAKRGEWRIPEIQLHTLEILGGSIGAFCAQKFFRHKCKKKSFKAIFYLTVVFQIGVVFFILKFLRFL